MSAPQLPEFDHCLAMAQGTLDAPELAECHGVLCGVLAVSPQAGTAEFISQLESLHLVENPDEQLRGAFDDLFRATAAQLDDDNMAFRLWLPDDEEPLEDRTEALARWCTGLLAGLATQGDLEGLQGEAEEAVQDLEQIARAGIATGTGATEEDREQDEKDFAEISEYVRIVTMILREDFRGPDQGEAIH